MSFYQKFGKLWWHRNIKGGIKALNGGISGDCILEQLMRLEMGEKILCY